MSAEVDHKAIATELGRFIEGFFLESQYREALSAKAAEFVHGFADERAADGNSYRYHATGLPAGGDKNPESSHGE